jgi:hypothetical protein
LKNVVYVLASGNNLDMPRDGNGSSELIFIFINIYCIFQRSMYIDMESVIIRQIFQISRSKLLKYRYG